MAWLVSSARLEAAERRARAAEEDLRSAREEWNAERKRLLDRIATMAGQPPIYQMAASAVQAEPEILLDKQDDHHQDLTPAVRMLSGSEVIERATRIRMKHGRG